jgi:EmrB/QacA subfamily drug resistance transporter
MTAQRKDAQMATLEQLDRQVAAPAPHDQSGEHSPWPGLWAMIIGFFMILIDTTIVSVATPAIMDDLAADVNGVIWVTSAYLLAYAVPLLVTGRLGDRFGPKYVYLVGLVVFTAASVWCGLTGTITMLIVARVLQGVGASMMTPQTMAVITRTFPAAKRGAAMALWGATAGVATLVGPILGGVLVDGPGWEWIFFINLPIGVIAFVAAWRLVPRLPTHAHSFDWLGVALSAAGMFLLVFGIQQGEKYDWGTISGFVTVPRLIVGGLAVFAAFLVWQSRTKSEPLVPLGLFRDRNFSVSNVGIALVYFATMSMAFPFMLYAQAVRGYSPTQAALLMVPMALFTGGLAPFVGRLVDHAHPRNITAVGFGAGSVALLWLSQVMTVESAVWEILAAMALFGVGNAFLWAPLSATATRNLSLSAAGAGSGVYNATRQVGGVLGSAAIAALMQARISAELPGLTGGVDAVHVSGGGLPAQVAAPFAVAMSQAAVLPGLALALGLVVALCYARPGHAKRVEAGTVEA